MKKVKLGEVATFINGYAFKPQDWSSEGKEIIRIQNLTKTSTEINYYSGTIDKKYIVEAGDILISWSGTLGVFQWRGRSAVLNQHIFKVVFDKIDIDKSYFKYVVEKGLQDAVKHTHGSTMKHLTKKYFDNIIVPYTNLGEQQRIASELDLLSKLILRRQEQLEELNLLVKSRFNEMFGENKIFESIDNLFDIIDGDRGKNYPKSDELFSEEYCLFLNTKNVTKNGFSFDTKQFITKTKDKLLRKGKLERYDIVLTIRGTVGNVAYYDELIKYKHLRINSGMVILRPKTPNLNQKFIIHVLRNNNYSRVISGSAQPQLPITKLKKILLPLPPLALQNEFADFVVQVDKSRFNEMFGENKIFESIDNLFDIIDGDRGKNYPKSDELFSEEYCLFLNTKNVTKNGFSFDTKQFITKTKDKLLRKGKLERYDIVLTIRGTVGNVAYYDELIKYKHLRINSGMVILRPKTPNLNQKFIIHVLRNNNYSRVISGSAQPQLPITKLKKILLPLPPLALQNEFADFVVQVDKSQLAIQKSLEELETLKKSLMQEYFG
ncbi:type I RM modification enzyme [Streptococcus pneumoniae]|nr:type I RM modification enzyme [Streptococcus pneumoniae]